MSHFTRVCTFPSSTPMTLIIQSVNWERAKCWLLASLTDKKPGLNETAYSIAGYCRKAAAYIRTVSARAKTQTNIEWLYSW